MKMIVEEDEEEEGKRSKSNGRRRIPVGSESTPNRLLLFVISTRMKKSCKLTRTYEISHFNYFCSVYYRSVE